MMPVMLTPLGVIRNLTGVGRIFYSNRTPSTPVDGASNVKGPNVRVVLEQHATWFVYCDCDVASNAFKIFRSEQSVFVRRNDLVVAFPAEDWCGWALGVKSFMVSRVLCHRYALEVADHAEDILIEFIKEHA